MPPRARGPTWLSPRDAERLRPCLDAFLASTDSQARIAFDPLEFPHRYRDPRDIEVSALLAAALAYGRADLFRPKVDALLKRMGPSPAAFVRALDVAGARELLSGFVYRFNVGTDVAVLLLGNLICLLAVIDGLFDFRGRLARKDGAGPANGEG